jgi:adenine-specific DNA glycosylase
MIKTRGSFRGGKHRRLPRYVSEISCIRLRVEAVKPYFLRFMPRCRILPALAAAEEERCSILLEGVFYYSRSRNLRRLRAS